MRKMIKLGRLHWIHWGVVALSIVLTIAAWVISNSQIQQKIQQRFEFQSGQVISQITERMGRYEDALKTGVVAIHTKDRKIDAKSWKKFSSALKIETMYPGINGIGVIYNLSKDDLNEFLQKEKRLRPDFKIHPVHNNKDLWPITYVEPVKGNEIAVGLDVAFENNRYKAAREARDSNHAQITGPITLVQDEKNSPGFLQFVPFYNSEDISTIEKRRKHFVGHVYAPFIMEKLIEGTLNQDTLKKGSRDVLFSIHDGDQLLYDELSPGTSGYDSNPIYRKKISIKMYQRNWVFTIHTAKSFADEIWINQSTYILIGGVFIDVLLIMLFVFLSGRDKKSLILVNEMTKKVLEGEEYFRHIIEAAPCGMIITDNKGVIERVNPQAEKLFGYDKEELLGENIDKLVPDRFRDNHSKHRDFFYLNQSQRRMGSDRNVFGLKKNGHEFPAEIGLASFSGLSGSKILSTVINMTEYVEVSNELIRSNKDLNDFAYIASHDLKAPLRGIVQLSGWIDEDISNIASDETKAHLKLLKSRALRLEKLLNDLLLYSLAGQHSGELNLVDTKELINVIYSLLNPPAGFTLKIDSSLPVFKTLSTPLETIFRNLLGNAIKHHDKLNGTISVSAKEHDNYYQFTVENDGPGIEFQYQDKIFEMFKTLKSRDEVEGSGMGLSIIKKILKHHEQSIKVYSNGDRGVAFTFTWPKNFLLLNDISTRI